MVLLASLLVGAAAEPTGEKTRKGSFHNEKTKHRDIRIYDSDLG